MFSANPRQVPEARLLSALDYAEAQEIATTGARCCIRAASTAARGARAAGHQGRNRPDLAGTTIAASAAQVAPSVKAISSRKGITLVSMESISMWQQVGFLADVFGRSSAHGLWST